MANPYKRIGAAKGNAAEGEGVGVGNTFRFPDNLGDPSSGGQHFMLIKAYDTHDPAMTSGATFAPTNDDNSLVVPIAWVCALFIPPAALKQAYSAKYSTLDYAGAVAAGAGGPEFGRPTDNTTDAAYPSVGGSAVAKFFQGSNDDRQKTIANITSGIAEGAKEGLAAFQKKAGAGMKLIQAASGAAPNSHQGVIYDGPGEFREHQFSWNMLPKNKKDAESIRNIVVNFKKSMLPGGTEKTGGGHVDYNRIDSSYWTFPDMFTIDFYINGHKFNRMNIYRSILKAMSVDFAGAESQVAFHLGRSEHSPGEPVGTILNLTFQETIHVTNENISK